MAEKNNEVKDYVAVLTLLASIIMIIITLVFFERDRLLLVIGFDIYIASLILRDIKQRWEMENPCG